MSLMNISYLKVRRKISQRQNIKEYFYLLEIKTYLSAARQEQVLPDTNDEKFKTFYTDMSNKYRKI